MVADLFETSWKRYGKHRVYLRTAGGADVGHVDLVARSIVPTVTGFDAELLDCLQRWTDNKESRPCAADPPLPPLPPSPPSDSAPADDESTTDSADVELANVGEPARDIAATIAGAAARAKRNEVNARAPIMNLIDRLLGVKTEERAWRVGAKGEEKVAKELAKLGPAWRVLHAVEVGVNGADIDHVVIGPAGVITLNAKCHPGAKAWVGENLVMVNGHRTDYLRNARFEAKRASKLLTVGCGTEVRASAAIVFVDLGAFTLKQLPSDVQVITRLRLLGWLNSLPTALDDQAVEMIYSKARLSSTWQ